jgi:hypothetical protein
MCCACKQVAATLPFNLASAITFSLIAYGMAGLHHSVYAAGMNCAVCCLVLMISQQVRRHICDLVFGCAITYCDLVLMVALGAA